MVDIEKGRIFFLGAGFSAAAGIPLTESLLPKAAELFNAEASGLFSRVATYADHVDVDLMGNPCAEDFARLCSYLDFVELREHGGGERWSNEGSRERMALKYYLAKAIANSIPADAFIPDCYLDFAKGLTKWDVIVTFNWDTLLERALRKVGLSFTYCFEENKLSVMKMHGSINWIQGNPDAMSESAPSFDYQPIGYATGMNEIEVSTSTELENSLSWNNTRCLTGEVKPLLVLPGYGKTVDLRLLTTLWYKPEFLGIRKGGISVIGLSVASDDYIVESLFRYLFRRILPRERAIRIVNPLQEVADKFRAMAPAQANIDFVQKKFDAHTVTEALLST